MKTNTHFEQVLREMFIGVAHEPLSHRGKITIKDNMNIINAN